MLSNFFKIALRSLIRFKRYTVINLFGLALGLTVGILILMYVLDELSYDKFQTKADRIYRVGTQFFNPKSGGAEGGMETNGWPVGQTLREYPEVESVLYTRSASSFLVNYDDKRIQQKIHFASPEFFTMFSFELIKGNRQKALTDPYSIVITQSMEQKYFNGQDALNKTLVLADSLPFVVTGVLQDVPSNSHMQFDMLISFSTFEVMNSYFSYDTGWGNINMRNYIMLKEGADRTAFEKKASHIYTERASDMLKDWGVSAAVQFEPLTSLYLTTKNGNGMGPVGSIGRVYLVGGIGIFAILLACINFINLTTARAVHRAKEVGLRKVVGSSRSGLIRQFLSESFVLTCLSLVVALAFTGLLLPLFNQLIAKDYHLSSLLSVPLVIGIALMVLLISFLSGYYPALVMSGMKPVEVLKGKIQSSTRGVQLRRGLVTFQFVISISLVLGTLVVVDQLDYMQKQNLGFTKEQVVVLKAGRVNAPEMAFETFKNEVKSLAMVENVTYANSLPGTRGWVGQVAYPEGNTGDDAVSVEYLAVDPDYVTTLGLKVIAGRNFDILRPLDEKEGLVLNKTAVSLFGWSSPADAIGKKITSPSGYPEGEVIGVVKDYHQTGLQQNVGPMVMDFNPGSANLYAVRYKAGDTQRLLENLSSLWKKNFGGYDFNYFFLDQDFEKQYQAENRLAKVFGTFSTVTIVIAMIGLLGLISFMVTTRTKEIGVRKVLGANVFNIAILLSKEFLILVVMANMITFPLVWYFANQWLSHFATRISISPLLFVISLSVTVCIALITISFQTVKAALSDPVNALRYE